MARNPAATFLSGFTVNDSGRYSSYKSNINAALGQSPAHNVILRLLVVCIRDMKKTQVNFVWKAYGAFPTPVSF